MARHSLTEYEAAERLALTSDHSPARTAAHRVRSICARCCLRGELPPTALLGGRTCWLLGRSGALASSRLHRGGAEEERGQVAGRSVGREELSTQAAPAAADTSTAWRRVRLGIAITVTSYFLGG